MVDVVGHVELGQDVAGHELALDLNLLAALDLGHRFGRHLDLLDAVRQAQPPGLGDDRLADLVLETRIRVNYVPACHDLPCWPGLAARTC